MLAQPTTRAILGPCYVETAAQTVAARTRLFYTLAGFRQGCVA